MRHNPFAFSFLMALGCAKGQEIDPQEVVILPVLPPSAADASVDSGSEPAAAAFEVSPPAPVVTPTPDVVEVSDAASDVEVSDAASDVEVSGTSPDVEVPDAAAPALSDSGT